MKQFTKIFSLILFLNILFFNNKIHAQTGTVWRVYNYTIQKLDNVQIGFKVPDNVGFKDFVSPQFSIDQGFCDPKIQATNNMVFTTIQSGLGPFPWPLHEIKHFYIILEDINHKKTKIYLSDPKTPGVFFYDQFNTDPCSRAMITYDDTKGEVYITP